MLVIALKLLVICGLTALLVAAVNAVTKDRIVLNGKIETAKSLSVIYEKDGLTFDVDENGNYVVRTASGEGRLEKNEPEKQLDDIDEVYTIFAPDGSTFGYCVKASPMGFKDEVNLLVAVNPDVSVKAVSVISHSETSGIGSKAAEPDFLNKFTGKTAGFSDTDLNAIIISGATRTSKPVILAVDRAVVQVNEIIRGKGDDPQ